MADRDRTAGIHILQRERAEALARRPSLGKMRACERGVEPLVRRVLTADLTDVIAELGAEGDVSSTPADSLIWARDTAAALRAASQATRRSRSRCVSRSCTCRILGNGE